ncbi:MAG TPA: HAMP domain-containing sensor histidine kinase [Gaiellaceae bacterium]|jgi:two-component system sensor histidine kinase MprB|nr:HAMP domain-containing sensor histidine kinase [Gaiellaceae bacterium]
MSFRLRLTVLTAIAVATAIVGASFLVYYVDRGQLIGQVDDELAASRNLPGVQIALNGPASVKANIRQSVKVNKARVKVLGPGTGKLILPRSLTVVQIQISRRAGGKTAEAHDLGYFSTEIDGVHSRALGFTAPGALVRLSTSLVGVDRDLTRLRWLLIFISLGGVGAAVLLGALVSGRALAPLRRLTATTEDIVATGDLTRRTGQRGRDEISRLSARLDELLAMLESSLRTQRQLVADASHELRTPITTVRANVELLAEPGSLDESERAELLVDVRDELESMTTLVGELVELARGEEPDLPAREFRLDEVVRTAVDRTARRAPEVSFRTRLEPSLVTGVPERVERAVANLLDNARKWSPANATVDVAVHDGLVEVRDRGPGIAETDRPRVFDRFYRSPAARGMPGAGLGLAIVKQIADAHGGTVTIDSAPDGGAVLRLQLSLS